MRCAKLGRQKVPANVDCYYFIWSIIRIQLDNHFIENMPHTIRHSSRLCKPQADVNTVTTTLSRLQ